MGKALGVITGVAMLASIARLIFKDEDHEQRERIKKRLFMQMMKDESEAVTDAKGIRWARYNGGIYEV